MNYEALGRAHHLKAMQAADVQKLQAMAHAMAHLARLMERHVPTPDNNELLAQSISQAQALLPEIAGASHRVTEFGAELARLCDEFNFKV
jgi:histidine ammonia-lyase